MLPKTSRTNQCPGQQIKSYRLVFLYITSSEHQYLRDFSGLLVRPYDVEVSYALLLVGSVFSVTHLQTFSLCRRYRAPNRGYHESWSGNWGRYDGVFGSTDTATRAVFEEGATDEGGKTVKTTIQRVSLRPNVFDPEQSLDGCLLSPLDFKSKYQIHYVFLSDPPARLFHSDKVDTKDGSPSYMFIIYHPSIIYQRFLS